MRVIKVIQMKSDKYLVTKLQLFQYVLTSALGQPSPRFIDERSDIFASEALMTGISPPRYVRHLTFSDLDLDLPDLAPFSLDRYNNKSFIFQYFDDMNDSVFDKVNSNNYEYLKALYYNKGNDL